MFTVELPVGVLIAVGMVTALLDLDLLEITENTENYLETSHLSGDTYTFNVFLCSGNAHQNLFLQMQYYWYIDNSSSVMSLL